MTGKSSLYPSSIKHFFATVVDDYRNTQPITVQNCGAHFLKIHLQYIQIKI